MPGGHWRLRLRRAAAWAVFALGAGVVGAMAQVAEAQTPPATNTYYYAVPVTAGGGAPTTVTLSVEVIDGGANEDTARLALTGGIDMTQSFTATVVGVRSTAETADAARLDERRAIDGTLFVTVTITDVCGLVGGLCPALQFSAWSDTSPTITVTGGGEGGESPVTINIINEILAAGATLTAADGEGVRAAHLAASVNHTAALDLLISMAAALATVQDTAGWTPAHFAAKGGAAAALTVLNDNADAGVTLNQPAGGGIYPADVAGSDADFRAAMTLLGATICFRDCQGTYTPRSLTATLDVTQAAERTYLPGGDYDGALGVVSIGGGYLHGDADYAFSVAYSGSGDGAPDNAFDDPGHAALPMEISLASAGGSVVARNLTTGATVMKARVRDDVTIYAKLGSGGGGGGGESQIVTTRVELPLTLPGSFFAPGFNGRVRTESSLVITVVPGQPVTVNNRNIGQQLQTEANRNAEIIETNNETAHAIGVSRQIPNAAGDYILTPYPALSGGGGGGVAVSEKVTATLVVNDLPDSETALWDGVTATAPVTLLFTVTALLSVEVSDVHLTLVIGADITAGQPAVTIQASGGRPPYTFGLRSGGQVVNSHGNLAPDNVLRWANNSSNSVIVFGPGAARTTPSVVLQNTLAGGIGAAQVDFVVTDAGNSAATFSIYIHYIPPEADDQITSGLNVVYGSSGYAGSFAYRDFGANTLSITYQQVSGNVSVTIGEGIASVYVSPRTSLNGVLETAFVTINSAPASAPQMIRSIVITVSSAHDADVILIGGRDAGVGNVQNQADGGVYRTQASKLEAGAPAFVKVGDLPVSLYGHRVAYLSNTIYVMGGNYNAPVSTTPASAVVSTRIRAEFFWNDDILSQASGAPGLVAVTSFGRVRMTIPAGDGIHSQVFPNGYAFADMLDDERIPPAGGQPGKPGLMGLTSEVEPSWLAPYPVGNWIAANNETVAVTLHSVPEGRTTVSNIPGVQFGPVYPNLSVYYSSDGGTTWQGYLAPFGQRIRSEMHAHKGALYVISGWDPQPGDSGVNLNDRSQDIWRMSGAGNSADDWTKLGDNHAKHIVADHRAVTWNGDLFIPAGQALVPFVAAHRATGRGFLSNGGADADRFSLSNGRYIYSNTYLRLLSGTEAAAGNALNWRIGAEHGVELAMRVGGNDTVSGVREYAAVVHLGGLYVFGSRGDGSPANRETVHYALNLTANGGRRDDWTTCPYTTATSLSGVPAGRAYMDAVSWNRYYYVFGTANGRIYRRGALCTQAANIGAVPTLNKHDTQAVVIPKGTAPDHPFD